MSDDRVREIRERLENRARHGSGPWWFDRDIEFLLAELDRARKVVDTTKEHSSQPDLAPRINVQLVGMPMALVHELSEKTGLSAREVIGCALGFLDWARGVFDSGKSVAVIDREADTVTEMVLHWPKETKEPTP